MVVHALRGRASNRRLPQTVRERALEKARQPLYHGFDTACMPNTWRGIRKSAVCTRPLWRWMVADGLWKAASQGKRPP